LVPRHERHRSPAGVVAEGEQRQRVRQEVDAIEVAEPALLVRQREAAIEFDGDGFAGVHGVRQAEVQGRHVVVFEPVAEVERIAGCDETGRRDDAETTVAVYAERGLEAEHFERLGELQVVALRHAVVRVEVEDEFVGRSGGRVRPGDALAELGLVFDRVDRDVQIVARQQQYGYDPRSINAK